MDQQELLCKLDAGLHCRLILIIAPRESGKTALLRQWMNTHSAGATRFAWLDLQVRHNELERFLRDLYLLLTERLGLSQICLEKCPMGLETNAISEIELESWLIEMINQLSEMADHLVLILDNYHVILNERIHQAIKMLLDYMPPRLHLAIASRSDPPLPVARLRARRQMVEINSVDLALNQDKEPSGD